jgi:hypothetical protein
MCPHDGSARRVYLFACVGCPTMSPWSVLVSQQEQDEEELQYRVAGPTQRWGEVAARTFDVSSWPPVVPFVQLSGTCPVCGHDMDQPEYLDQFSGIGPGEKGLLPSSVGEAVRIDADIDVVCDCDVAHPGSDGKRGCGRRWRLHLSWNDESHTVSAPVVPTGGDFEAMAQRQALAQGELLRVRSAADKWRTALAGLFTLATGLLVIKGRDTIDGLVDWARYLAGGLAALGLGLAIFGATRAMRAAFGKPRLVALFDPAGHRVDHRGRDRFDAQEARSDLRTATWCTMGSLLALGVAVATMWYAPAVKAPGHWVEVTRLDTTVVCGDLLASDSGEITLRRSDTSELIHVPLAAVASLRVVDDCTGR